MLTNYHTHTTRCGHAEGTEEEYILTALRCGYKVLGFSDHTPWAYATPGFVSRIRMLPSQLDDYVLTLRRLREKYADKLHIRIGLEAEYFPAYLGWLREEMERLDIEYLILGCHYDTTDEQDARASRFGGSPSTAHGRRYAEQVVEALETGLYRYLAHPDLFLNRVTAFDADAEKACRDICAAAARLDIPLEYNMAGLTLQGPPRRLFRLHPGRVLAHRGGVPRQGHRGLRRPRPLGVGRRPRHRGKESLSAQPGHPGAGHPAGAGISGHCAGGLHLLY